MLLNILYYITQVPLPVAANTWLLFLFFMDFRYKVSLRYGERNRKIGDVQGRDLHVTVLRDGVAHSPFEGKWKS